MNVSRMTQFSVYFFEKILQNSHSSTVIQVTDFQVEKACENGENFLSVVSKIILKVKTNQVDSTTSLIIKQPHTIPAVQEIFSSDRMFRNEVIAYRYILPDLQKYCKVPLPVAKSLFADHNCIILEDLCVYNYEMIRTEKTLNNDKCTVVLQELAVLHAASILLKQRNPERFQYLAAQAEHGFKNNKAIARFIYKSFQTALHLLHSLKRTAEVEQAISVVEELSGDIYERVTKLMLSKSSDATAVFIHGDCWRNNILFRTSPTGETNVKFIDLQGMAVTSLAQDLSYFLYVHTTPETRHQNLDELLGVYIKSLHRILAEHDLQELQKVYSKAWLEKEMSDFIIFGFMCSVWVTPVFYMDKDAVNAVDVAEWKDYDSETVTHLMSPELKDRIISTILDFTKSYNS